MKERDPETNVLEVYRFGETVEHFDQEDFPFRIERGEDERKRPSESNS